MSKTIRLSKKHGVNPCIPICFWCGQDKNEILLLGQLPGDREAPMHAVFDKEPCEKCLALMSQGVTLMESLDGKEPTGTWAVITHEAAEKMFNIPIKDKAFIDPQVWDMVGLPRSK